MGLRLFWWYWGIRKMRIDSRWEFGHWRLFLVCLLVPMGPYGTTHFGYRLNERCAIQFSCTAPVHNLHTRRCDHGDQCDQPFFLFFLSPEKSVKRRVAVYLGRRELTGWEWQLHVRIACSESRYTRLDRTPSLVFLEPELQVPYPSATLPVHRCNARTCIFLVRVYFWQLQCDGAEDMVLNGPIYCCHMFQVEKPSDASRHT